MSQDFPSEPLTPTAEAVAGLREMFTSLAEGGFTEWQACRIIGVYIAEAGRQQ
jgi:hypothetical protein